MKHINLSSPVVRESELPYSEFRYSATNRSYLPIPSSPLTAPFIEVLESRRTRRKFGKLSQERLSALLWYSGKTRATWRETSGYLWQHRPSPSGGGRHPLDLFVLTTGLAPQKDIKIYDPIAHALCQLEIDEPTSLISFLKEVNSPVEICADGTLLWFGAQFDRTMSKYENGESLVWRDAGALTATISLVCEALGMGCCPLGMSGEPWFSTILASKELVVGAGGCIVGERVDNG